MKKRRQSGCVGLLVGSLMIFAAIWIGVKVSGHQGTPPDEYGGRPVFYEDAFGGEPTAPSAVKRVIKKTLNDPGSFRMLQIISMDKDERNGVKCYKTTFTFSAKNGFGGMTSTTAVAWMRGSELIDIKTLK